MAGKLKNIVKPSHLKNYKAVKKLFYNRRFFYSLTAISSKLTLIKIYIFGKRNEVLIINLDEAFIFFTKPLN